MKSSRAVDGRSSEKVKELRSEMFKKLRSQEGKLRAKRLLRSKKASSWTKADARTLRKAFSEYNETSGNVKVNLASLIKLVDAQSTETGDKLFRAVKTPGMLPAGTTSTAVKMLISGQLCRNCRKFVGDYFCLGCRRLPELREEYTNWYVRKRERTFTEQYGAGITNCMQVDSVKRKVAASMKRSYGVTNIAKLPSRRKAASERLQVPENHARLMDGLERRYGVRNAMQIPMSKVKCAETWAQNYEHGHPLRDPEILKKAKANCKETFRQNYEHGHPFREPRVFTRAMESAHRIHTLNIDDRLFGYQGYEGYVIQKLALRFGAENVVGQFMKERESLPWKHHLPYFKTRRGIYYPDLYLKNFRLFIEVKGYYTFLSREENFISTQAKAKGIQLTGKKVAVVVAEPKKDVMILLPPSWITWNYEKTKAYLNDRGLLR